MSNFHDFLVKHAMFPFPEPDDTKSVVSTDISELEVGLLGKGWKAGHAVRDDTLVQKLCDVLQDILGDTALPPGAENHLLSFFSPKLGVTFAGEVEDEWLMNPNEAHVSFPKYFFTAEQFELALTLRTESDAARQGFRRRQPVLGCVWVTQV
jgi:hypothetical protein